MKNVYCYFVFILFICSCKDKDSLTSNAISIAKAQEVYSKVLLQFGTNDSYLFIDTLPTSLNWKEAYERRISNEPCLILKIDPAHNRQIADRSGEYLLNAERYLLFRSDKKGEIKFNVVVFFANSNLDKRLSVLVFNGSGQISNSFVSDGSVLFPTDLEIIKNENLLSRSIGNITCIETDWYTCLSFRDVSYGCNYNYTTRQCINIPDGGGGDLVHSLASFGASGNFDYNSVPAIRFKSWVVAPPSDRSIVDIKKYFSCFTLNNKSSYEVTLYVKQPIPNSRFIVSDGYGNKFPSSLDLNSLTVGHSFLGFSQGDGSAMSVRRYVGFYPSTMVSPFLPETPGAVADNSNTDYDVAVTFKVSPAEFKTIMDQFQAATKSNYNLNWNNCTDVCISSLNIIGLKIPMTIGSWPLGKGYNPADLGQDLRLFNSDYIKQKNLTGGTSPSNSAPCK